MYVPNDLKSALLDYSHPSNSLAKSSTHLRKGGIDRSKLVLQDVVDVNGNHTKRWKDLSPDEEKEPRAKVQQPEEKNKRKKEVKPDAIANKVSKEEKFQQRVQEIQKQYPSLSEESIKTRMKLMIPMDATNVKVFDSDPKYICEFKDSRGRTQKRYTQEYSQQASVAKFEKMREVGKHLPEVRKQVEKDLAQPGFGKNKVCAMITKLIDKCYFRIGNDKYTEENGTYGVSTLRKDHIDIDGTDIHFRYVGKKSVDQHQFTTDPQMAKMLSQLMDDSPGDRLFQYQDESGNWRKVDNNDVRKYLKQWGMTPKNFRTYHASRMAATKLAEFPPTDDINQRKKNIKEAVEYTAAFLGHTPSICRSSYINGEILQGYLDGEVMEKWSDGFLQEFSPPKQKKTMKASSKELKSKIVENGGITIDIDSKEPNKGYAYAPYKGTEVKIPEGDFSEHHIDDYITKHLDELNEEGNHLGVWFDDGSYYMDISRVGEPNEKTLKEAEAADQLAVFDLANFETIYTGVHDSHQLQQSG